MKVFILSFLTFLLIQTCHGQLAVTSLNENFNTSCLSATPFPSHWTQFAEFGNQTWLCSPNQGINGSPCMTVNDYTTTHNIDTQILYTPKLDLSGHNHIYLNFFDRFARNGDSLGIYVTNQNGTADPLCDSCSWTKIVVGFTAADTLWAMHQVDLTPYKAKDIYIAFKYTSTDSTGSIWYIDSVFTTETVYVNNVVREHIPLTVLGLPGGDDIALECTLPVAGIYQLRLYDLTGREMMSQTITKGAGMQRLLINSTTLAKGMYIIRLGNDSYSGFVKALVQ
jgi:hypothetical protein